MSAYYWIKLLHILSATILFGTGIGTAFFMYKAIKSQNREAIRITTQNVVLADWLFTTPAVVIQLPTGIWLTIQLNIPFESAWFVIVISMFIIIGACWIPVVWIQIRIREIITGGGEIEDTKRLMRYWISLGIPAFSCVLILYFLMVSKIGVGYLLF